jgi:hypothetical protein
MDGDKRDVSSHVYSEYSFRANGLDICNNDRCERGGHDKNTQTSRLSLRHWLILVVRTVPPKININKVINPCYSRL